MARTRKLEGKYVDPRTDFGMKFYFGRVENKKLLIRFLNDLFQGEKIIEDLHYGPVEHDGDFEDDRKVVFDLYCTGAEGELFIIEMQQIYQDFFKDRAVYYTSRLINKQLAKGRKGNGYHLPEVYFVGILEFEMDKSGDQYFYDIALCERTTNEVFYDKLGYKFIVLPKFNKAENELANYMEQWFYLLKNLHRWNEIPKVLDKRIFGLIFEIGEIAKLNKEDQMAYEASRKRKMDMESVLSSARRLALEQGLEQGLQKGLERGKLEERTKAEAEKRESALKMLQNGFDMELIADIIGLPIDEIEKLK